MTAALVTAAIAYPLGVISGLVGVRLHRAIRRENRRQNDILHWFDQQRLSRGHGARHDSSNSDRRGE